MSDKTAKKYGTAVVRHNRELKMVKLGLLRVSPVAQQKFREYWGNEIAANFDLDKLGTPEVSHRDGYFYVMDGQHRIYGLKHWLGKGWEDQHVQCWVAEGLSEKDEADVFLGLNNKKNPPVYQKYRVALTAERRMETEVENIVRLRGLKTSSSKGPGAITCVGTLMKCCARDGATPLSRSLKLAHESFGDPGLESSLIDGFSLLCRRYNGVLDESSTISSLSGIRGGVNGLLGQAEQLRRKTGGSKAQCVAATAVEIVNRGRTGKNKLPAWFKE